MKNNQQLFQMIMNHTSDMLMIVDRNRHIVYITPNAYEFTGYSHEELENRDTFFLLHPDDREYMVQRHKNLLSSKHGNSAEYRLVKKNGEVRYCECKTTPLPDTENYLQVVSTRDITKRKLMEMELEYHKNRHEELQTSLKNFSQDLISVMKLAELEERMVKQLVTILPSSNPLILKSFPENAGCKPRDEVILLDGKMVRISDRVFIKIGDRQRCPYILSIAASAIHEPMESIWLETLAHYSMMVFENIKMIENLMEQLETASRSKESPQWVLRMIFNLQEQQRLTLSTDLHDTVLQDQIDLYRRMESLLTQNIIESEAKAKLIEIEQGLLDIIHAIRVTCNQLRPPLLRELGLEKSLENLFEHIQLTSTYKINFTSEDFTNLSLSEEQTIGIYRIVQEFLYYAEECSRANTIEFTISCEKDRLMMVYSDDDLKSNEVEEKPSTESVRLTSVSQRAQSLGGELHITPKQGCGLVAQLELPIKLERSFV
jgi:two-component system, NarL family, sensor histidine kinase ComP